MFEVAYFWRLDPAVVLRMPIDQAALYDKHASRISQLMHGDDS